MFQSWQELLFAHWPIAYETLRRLVPRELVVDQFDGTGWVTLAPFRIVGLRPRYLPPLPRLSNFPEMNFRTYVRFGEKPGIYFFTLEAASAFAVAAARLTYRLPYHLARMSIERQGEWVRYESRRPRGDVAFSGRYRALGSVFHAQPGSLEYFLAERYALYEVLANGKVLRGDIHHEPWPLQVAEAEIRHNSVPAAYGIELPQTRPVLHYSARQDTLVWPPKIAKLQD
jgi:uncharacterized protein YqjF (DUF2071 family)